MKDGKLLREAHQVADRLRINDGHGFRLSEFDPRNTLWFKDKSKAQESLAHGVRTLSALQEKLYAQAEHSVLIILQALDAAGKDSTIDHVMSGVNPQGCHVYSFKVPSLEERAHDFLWRCAKCLPRRGEIAIFNRSQYEEVLVVKVHQELLKGQNLPNSILKDKHFWERRYQSLQNFERHLTDNGTTVIKIFLHVSKAEQKKRFEARLDDPAKNWKFSAVDVTERGFRKQYMDAYEAAIQHTATRFAPWYVVPADHKWFTRMAISNIIVSTMAGLHLKFPTMSPAKLRELAAARRLLMK